MMHLLLEHEFWVLLGFIIFVGLIWNKARLALAGGLDARAERIRQQIAEAETLRAEAEAMLRDAEHRHRAAVQEAAAMLAAATREAARLKDQAIRDIAALLDRRRHAAVEKIAQAEAAAIAEVRQFAVDVAIAATRQVLTAQVQGALAERMIDQAIGELPRRLS
ncbi:MAG: F0F1 ATP synthase subunit B [Proteobacteria bacterium]|nr:F0F1 ATP synthase subunit B [Pseudomonadota bacterium]